MRRLGQGSIHATTPSQLFARSYTCMLTDPVTFSGEVNLAIVPRSADASMCRADGPMSTNAATCLCCNSISHWQARVSSSRKNGFSASEMRNSFLESISNISIELRNSCMWCCAGNATINRPSRFRVRNSSDAGRGANTFKAISTDSDLTGSFSKMSVTTESRRGCAWAARRAANFDRSSARPTLRGKASKTCAM